SGSAATATRPGSSARASVRRAPARAPRSAAALVTAWMTGPCVPSTVRTTGASGAEALDFAQRSTARFGNQMESTRIMGDAPAPGRSDARPEQLGIPSRQPRRFLVELVEQRRRGSDPPAHARATEVRRPAEADQKGGHARPLGCDGESPRRGEVERARVAPDLADHAGEP